MNLIVTCCPSKSKRGFYCSLYFNFLFPTIIVCVPRLFRHWIQSVFRDFMNICQFLALLTCMISFIHMWMSDSESVYVFVSITTLHSRVWCMSMYCSMYGRVSVCRCTHTHTNRVNGCYLTDVGADASLPEALTAELHCHLTAHGVLLTDLLKGFLPNNQPVNYWSAGAQPSGDSSHPHKPHPALTRLLLLPPFS